MSKTTKKPSANQGSNSGGTAVQLRPSTNVRPQVPSMQTGVINLQAYQAYQHAQQEFRNRRDYLNNQIQNAQAQIDQLSQELATINETLGERSSRRTRSLGKDAQAIYNQIHEAATGSTFTKKQLQEIVGEDGNSAYAIQQLLDTGHMTRVERGIYAVRHPAA